MFSSISLSYRAVFTSGDCTYLMLMYKWDCNFIHRRARARGGGARGTQAEARKSLSTFVPPCRAMRVTSVRENYIYLKRWSTVYLVLWLYCFHPAPFLLFVVYLSHPSYPRRRLSRSTARIYLCLRDTPAWKSAPRFVTCVQNGGILEKSRLTVEVASWAPREIVLDTSPSMERTTDTRKCTIPSLVSNCLKRISLKPKEKYSDTKKDNSSWGKVLFPIIPYSKRKLLTKAFLFWWGGSTLCLECFSF